MEYVPTEVEPALDRTLASWKEPISIARKCGRLFLWLLGFAVLLSLFVVNFQDGGMSLNLALLGALGFSILALGIIQFVTVREITKYRTELVKVPFLGRLREAILWLFAGFAFASMPIFELTFTSEIGNFWGVGLLSTCLLAYGSYLLLKPDRHLLTAAGRAAKETDEKLQAGLNSLPPQTSHDTSEKQPIADNWPFDERWWIRYPIALCVSWLGYFCAFEWTHKLNLIAAAFLWFIAAALAREVLLWTIGFGVLALVVWGLWAGIASLPISLAIVLGAMIIAFAINNRR